MEKQEVEVFLRQILPLASLNFQQVFIYPSAISFSGITHGGVQISVFDCELGICIASTLSTIPSLQPCRESCAQVLLLLTVAWGYHMGYRVYNPGWPCVRQMLTLCTLFWAGPIKHFKRQNLLVRKPLR